MTRYAEEISLAIRSPGKPYIRVIHNDGVVRLEFAGIREKILRLFDYFSNDDIPKYNLPCLLGQGVSGKKVWCDIATMPHLLIGGTTGSGKSILLHNIIANLYNYSSVNLFLVDTKIVEFSPYETIKEGTQVVKTYDEAVFILEMITEIMEERYKQYKDIEKFPYIILIIDEFSDLIMQDESGHFYELLCKLAQKCRGAKINILLATQHPIVKIISGEIKANFPARISCRTASALDSRIILDCSGAENLSGCGDCLIKDGMHNMERFQVAYTDAMEVVSIYE